ncbi:MAG TPA: hypothetical protein VM432_00050 [Bdellovibrionales bacterium]|jgi:hypothetical protein|nr:hypothetical protein [Bdellovibrionales bacterium]
MATKLKHQQSDNVVAMPTRCACDGCSKKSELQNFCAEHYDWFKFGLITKEGKKPIDFDKKFMAFKKHAA